VRTSGTYRAYCTSPLVTSWLGSGTSLRSRLARPYPAWGWTALAASLRDEVERAAAARKGASEVVGLAVQLGAAVSFGVEQSLWKTGSSGEQNAGKRAIQTHLAGPARRLSSQKTASCDVCVCRSGLEGVESSKSLAGVAKSKRALPAAIQGRCVDIRSLFAAGHTGQLAGAQMAQPLLARAGGIGPTHFAAAILPEFFRPHLQNVRH